MEKRERHIFIVDDFKDSREMCARFLGEHGFRVTELTDGKDALAKAAYLQPDLIVMELLLPGLDGLEVARRLKGSTETRHIPVIILTAYDFAAANQVGCEGFLTKPCLPDRMVSEITRVLEHHPKESVRSHAQVA